METLITLALLAFSLGSVISLECGVPPMFRRECGYYGIAHEKCETERGCCWDESIENTEFCFHDAEPQCHVEPMFREECGFVGITEDECEQKGCCFNNKPDPTNLVPNVKWCFEERNVTCEVKPEDREECGYFGITRGACERRGCCFNSNIHGVKWCFKGKSKLEAAIEAEEEDEGSALL